MKKASTRLLEQETQTPSPAPDLIPAESSTENLHWDWYSKRGHFSHADYESGLKPMTGPSVRLGERLCYLEASACEMHKGSVVEVLTDSSEDGSAELAATWPVQSP